MKWRNVHDWIKFMEDHVRRDDDNLLLFTGKEGIGKSTLMIQVMKALDPDFNEDRIHFSVEDFLHDVVDVPRYGAISMDEALINRRKSGSKTNIRLLDHLQVCRGLNHHIAICFPHESRLDRAVLEDRVHFKIVVPKRGEFRVFEKRKREWRDPRTGEIQLFVDWVIVGAWTFAKNTGPLAEAYDMKKEMAMRARAAGEDLETLHSGKSANPRRSNGGIIKDTLPGKDTPRAAEIVNRAKREIDSRKARDVVSSGVSGSVKIP